MRRLALLLASVALPLSGADLHAQRVTVDLRGVVTMSTEDLPNTDLGTGYGFGGTLALRVMPHLHLYGGWDWLHFAPDQSFRGPNMDFEETGYTFGLRFEHPFVPTSALAYRIEAGGIYKHVEIEDDGDVIEDTGHDLGFELGLGAVVPLGTIWRLTPALRYRSVALDFAAAAGDMRYTALEVGISRRF
ncbi:MAG TPA: outer membrane beta-barrel protein [Gemmatimonadaceae bacterium]